MKTLTYLVLIVLFCGVATTSFGQINYVFSTGGTFRTLEDFEKIAGGLQLSFGAEMKKFQLSAIMNSSLKFLEAGIDGRFIPYRNCNGSKITMGTMISYLWTPNKTDNKNIFDKKMCITPLIGFQTPIDVIDFTTSLGLSLSKEASDIVFNVGVAVKF